MKQQSSIVAVALTAIALFAGATARTFMSPVQELFKADLAITDAQVALLQGAAFAIPAALLAVPLGRWVDRANRSRLLLALTLLCGAAGVVAAFAQDFATMMAARMLVGVAVAGTAPAALSLVADIAPANRRGSVMSIIGLGQAAGQSLTFAFVGALLAHVDAITPAQLDGLAPWRVAQLVFACGMFFVAALLLLLREPARSETGSAMGGTLGQVLRETWAMRRVLLPLIVGLTAILMADTAALIWAVPVLTRFLHQQPADFGTWMGTALLVSGVGGVILGGWAADFGQRKRGRMGVMSGAALICTLSIPAAFFPMAPDVGLFAALFSLTIFAGAAVSIMASTAISVLFPNELRGLCVTILTAVGMLVSFGIAPSLVTLVASMTGAGEDIRVPLTIVGVAASALATLALASARPANETLS